MTKDILSPKLKGHLLIKTGDQILFEDHNEIVLNAKSVLTGCLTNLTGSNQIDTISAIGDFGEVEFNVTEVQYTKGSTSIKFITEIGDGTVNGNIQFMSLKSTNLGQFSNKQLTNVYKDNNIMLTIEWTIIIL